MGCTKSLTLNQASGGDMALDQAIYESSTGFIYGVRGQWLFKFSATNGSLVASLKFSTDAFGAVSCLTAFGGTIYIGVLYTPITDYNAGNSPGRDIFKVDAASFTVTGRFNLGSVGMVVNDLIPAGYRFLSNDGTNLAGMTWQGSGSFAAHDTTGLFNFVPSNIAGTFHRSSFGMMDDMTYDSVHNCYWLADSYAPNIWAIQAAPIFNGVDAFDTGGANNVHGVCYNQAQDKVYGVLGTEAIYMINNVAAAFPLNISGGSVFIINTLHTSRINANPFRIKSVNGLPGNPYNGKLLIPAWNDDTVLIWNPLTDNPADMLVKTGFTAPIDIVVCPTTNFAVQTGTVGLKQIT